MSIWGHLNAQFVTKSPGDTKRLLKTITLEVRERTAPITGSESGPQVYDQGGKMVVVNGDLRDVRDFPDTFKVLAWWASYADDCERAEIEWTVDTGQRYEFVWTWRNGLERIKRPGVLD